MAVCICGHVEVRGVDSDGKRDVEAGTGTGTGCLSCSTLLKHNFISLNNMSNIIRFVYGRKSPGN